MKLEVDATSAPPQFMRAANSASMGNCFLACTPKPYNFNNNNLCFHLMMSQVRAGTMLNLAGYICICLNQSKVSACRYAMGLSNDSQLQAVLLQASGNLMILVLLWNSLSRSRLKCKPVQQCISGSTLLASFECCNPVCTQSITANTRKSRLTDAMFLLSAGPM